LGLPESTGYPTFVNLVSVQHGSGYKPSPLATPEGCSLQEAGQAVRQGPTG
jgi:hypothetical protein